MIQVKIIDTSKRKTIASLTVADGNVPRLGERLELPCSNCAMRVKAVIWDFTDTTEKQARVTLQVRKAI